MLEYAKAAAVSWPSGSDPVAVTWPSVWGTTGLVGKADHSRQRRQLPCRLYEITIECTSHSTRHIASTS